jgi:hypothetical protein
MHSALMGGGRPKCESKRPRPLEVSTLTAFGDSGALGQFSMRSNGSYGLVSTAQRTSWLVDPIGVCSRKGAVVVK